MTKSNKYQEKSIEAKVTQIRIKQIFDLGQSYKIRQLTPYQFRIDEKIDLYPTSGKYHDLIKNEWGFYPAYDFKTLMQLYQDYNLIIKKNGIQRKF